MNPIIPRQVRPVVNQRTMAYPADGPPSPQQMHRCKMALVRGSGGSHSVNEIACFLRGRLRIASLIIFGGLALFLVKNLLDPQHALAACPTERGLHVLATVIAAGLAGLLWGPWIIPVRQLRLIEFAMFGTVATLFSFVQYAWFYEGRVLGCAAAGEGNTVASVYHLAAFGVSVRWFTLIVLYGTLIPNTWRR